MQRGRQRAMWDQIVFTISPHLTKGTNPYSLNPLRKKRSGGTGPRFDATELQMWIAECEAKK